LKKVILSLAGAVFLAGCSGGGSGSASSLNPFARAPQPEQTLATRNIAPDGRELIASVAELRAEPTRNGVILRARGVAQELGYYDVELAETNSGNPDENGVLTFELRGRPPVLPEPTTTERSREFLAATFISNITLKSVKALRVIAAQNQITIRK
jgi:hypothetical protein